MESIVIYSNSKKEIALLKQLSQKMGLTSHILTTNGNVDITLAQAIKQNEGAKNLLKEDAPVYSSLMENED